MSGELNIFGDPITPVTGAPGSAPGINVFGDKIATGPSFTGAGAGGSWIPETTGEKIADVAKKVAAGGINLVGQVGGATAGALGGTALEPGGGTVLGGMAGSAAGTYAAGQVNQALGLSAPASAGDVAASAITGMVPGESLIGAGLGKVLTSAGKAVAANEAATIVKSEADEGTLPTATQLMIAGGGAIAGTALGKAVDSGKNLIPVQTAAAQNASEDATLATGRAAGYVVPPFETNPSAANNLAGSVGGKAATKQAATIKNQFTTNQLAKAEIGLPANKPITEEGIQAVQDAAYAPYQKIAAISQSSAQDLSTMRAQWLNQADPHAAAIAANDPLYKQLAGHLETVSAADVNALRDARKTATANWQAFNRGGGASAQQAAETASQTAQDLEDKIGAAATAIGDPTLLNQLQQSRKLLAQTHVVEGATNFANGEVSAAALGRLYKKGVPLTGNLKTIGQFQQAFPTYTGLGSTIPAPGVSKLAPLADVAVGALAGGESHNLIAGGLAAAATHAAPGLTRSAMLSGPVQNGMLSFLSRPSYGSAPNDIAGLMARYGGMSASQPQSIPPYLAAPSQ